MPQYLALLRGINVGGHRKLPMKALINLLENLGFQSVQTYIQSGNVLFETAQLQGGIDAKIADAIDKAHGFRPSVMVMNTAEFKQILARCPFDATMGKALQFYFLATSPTDPHLNKLQSLKKPSEDFTLVDRCFYLWAPEGIGRSKLATHIEAALGVACTARNGNTVSKIASLIQC